MSKDTIVWTAFSLEKDHLFDYALLSLSMGPVKGDKLEEILDATPRYLHQLAPRPAIPSLAAQAASACAVTG